MSKYGSFKYGTGVKYGDTYAQPGIAWGFEFDWDNDGLFDGQNENDWVVDFYCERGRDYMLRLGEGGSAVGYERITVGTASITLVNRDDRYSPLNTSSPLYPNVSPGRLAKIRVRDNNTGAIFPVITGKIKDIQPITDSDLVVITIEDGMKDLQSGSSYIAIQEDIAIDDAMILLINHADYPWGYDIGNSTEIIPFWWSDAEAHATALQDLADADLGNFFIAADGKASFKGRNTINPILFDITQADVLKEIATPQPWENLRDATEVIIYPRELSATSDLWRLADIPLIPDGETRTYWTSFTVDNQPVPAKSLVSPAATTDYTMNTQSGGGGSNLTSGFSVVMTGFSKSSKLVVTNNSGSAGHVTLLKQRGDALISPYQTTVKGGTGKRVFILDNKWIQTTVTGEAYAGEILNRLDSVLQLPTVQLEARADIQFWPDLFSSILGDFEKLNIRSDFSIGKITHQWLNENGQTVLTRWKLEPFSGFDGGWIFPVQLGIDSEFVL